jgi:hypothetical protein
MWSASLGNMTGTIARDIVSVWATLPDCIIVSHSALVEMARFTLILKTMKLSPSAR